jgi:hypothetical protein
MKSGISIFTACIAGILLASVGSYLTGFTAAFVMPEIFANIMWLWDAIVIQFLGFGILAAFLAFVHTKFFSESLVKSLLIPLAVSQIILMYPFTYSVYWTHLFVVLGSLTVGFLIAKETHNKALNT